MAPRTRNNRRRVVEVAPTVEDLLKTKLADTMFHNGNEYSSRTNDILSDFLENVNKLVIEVSTEHNPSNEVKTALKKCLENLHSTIPIHVKKEIKREAPTEETSQSIESEKYSRNDKKQKSRKDATQSSAVDSLEDVSMESLYSRIASEVFGVRSETITSSSEDELDKTAISETTNQLEEMSITEELDLNIPLHTSTPLKEDILSATSRKMEHVMVLKSAKDTKTRKTTDTEDASSGNKKVNPQSKAQISIHKETKPIARMRNNSVIDISPNKTDDSPGPSCRRNILCSKSENRPTINDSSTVAACDLNTPKQETIPVAGSDRNAHASNLRFKFLTSKNGKTREDDDKSEVLRKRNFRDMKKSEKYKSPPRNDVQLKSTETLTPGKRPTKKSRIQHHPEKETKAPLLTKPKLGASNVNSHPQTSDSSSKKTITSYQLTPDRVYKQKSNSDYGIDDLSSSGETDDERHPRKKIPEWARNQKVIKENVRKQIENPPFNIEEFFGEVEKPNLKEIFASGVRSKKRGSSACWDHVPENS